MHTTAVNYTLLLNGAPTNAIYISALHFMGNLESKKQGMFQEYSVKSFSSIAFSNQVNLLRLQFLEE